ncbi:MAG: response regulator transcription factor [Nitrospira sp.]|nr:response regulator transcription factor [Nitrospira sp.]MBX3340796.1 response regulator transcription factor [Nitrospira sp.]MBX3369682.1 response regulator transcription factor [Nitrospira sp.]HNC84140.1 response regulator transcription factor [Nitrospira sp.]HNK75792.1 response regulator transcription factor [Nitrospira sp.]
MALEIIEIVEDDQSQAKLLDQILRQASYRTNVAFDGPAGMQDVWRIKPSLIVADDNLPGLTGREMCKRLRQDPSTTHIPIIVMSGFSSEERRAEALDAGADDFIVKPYSGMELLARVRALLRRCRQSQAQDEELPEDLALTENLYVAVYRGKNLTLSAHEWKALRRLASTVGNVVPREELKSLLWGDDSLMHDGELDRCMQQLNRKLSQDAPSVESIKIVPGGFRLSTPASDDSGGPAVH